MGTIWVREFTGGLDGRRLPETTPGGSLIRATDGHITRGGDFEKRAAFVPEYDLPAGETVGLAATAAGLVVFGHGDPPDDMPLGVSYQRLQHEDGSTELVEVPSFDLFKGKIYAVGEFADGARYHFNDGVRIPDWYDGRARASFRVTAGAVNPAVAASGSFEVTGGTSNPGVNEITDITIDGVSIISSTDIDHTGSNATTAAAIASAINSHTSSPNYTATANGQTVTVTAAATGTAPNGKAIIVSVAGDVTIGNSQNMAGGAAASTSELSDLKVDGVSIISAPVVWATSNTNMAELIAAAINGYTSSPDYEATAVGEAVNIVAVSAGEAANGRTVAFTLANGLAVDPESGLALAGGEDPVDAVAAAGSLTVTGGTNNVANRLTNLTINGVSIIDTGSPIQHTGTNSTTASAIASAINSYSSSPNYSATADGAVVTITAADTGPAINGESIVPTVTGDFTIGNLQAMSGGADSESTFVPGTAVKTLGSRVLSVSGPNLHGSGIAQPTKWTTDTTGAFFVDMSSQAAGAEQLIALAEYQNYVAVLAERVILIWSIQSDPDNNAKQQVLRNTGTASPRSVTQFGDADVFYLDESGLRSLRARDSSNAAATTDIGVPVDTLIKEKLAEMSDAERRKVFGLIEPGDGRFWLCMIDKIFVFSFFAGSKVSAWSTYSPHYYDESGTKVDFEIDEAVVFNRRVYIRSGDKIFVYGGLETGAEKDATEAEGWLPFLDGGSPGVDKQWTGFDCACRGLWEVRIATDPNKSDDDGAQDLVARPFQTTYSDESIGALGKSTHISLRFRSKGTGERVMSSCAIYFKGDE